MFKSEGLTTPNFPSHRREIYISSILYFDLNYFTHTHLKLTRTVNKHISDRVTSADKNAFTEVELNV